MVGKRVSLLRWLCVRFINYLQDLARFTNRLQPGFVIRNRNEDIKHNKTGTYVERHSTAMVI